MKLLLCVIAICVVSTRSEPLPSSLDGTSTEPPTNETKKPFGLPIGSPIRGDNVTIHNHGMISETSEGCSLTLLRPNVTEEFSEPANVSVLWYYETREDCKTPTVYREYMNCTGSFPPSKSSCDGYSFTGMTYDGTYDAVMINASLVFKPGFGSQGVYGYAISIGSTIAHIGSFNVSVPKDGKNYTCFLNYGPNTVREKSNFTDSRKNSSDDNSFTEFRDELNRTLVTYSYGGILTYSNGSSFNCTQNSRNKEPVSEWSKMNSTILYGDFSFDDEEVTISEDSEYNQGEYESGGDTECMTADPWIKPARGVGFVYPHGGEETLFQYYKHLISGMPTLMSYRELIDLWLTKCSSLTEVTLTTESDSGLEESAAESSSDEDDTDDSSSMQSDGLKHTQSGPHDCTCTKEMLVIAAVIGLLNFVIIVSLIVHICVLRTKIRAYKENLVHTIESGSLLDRLYKD